VLPDAKLSNGKFSTASEFLAAGGIVMGFKATGAFTSSGAVKGTVTGNKACGGSDTYSLKGAKAPARPTVGPTK